MEHEIVDRKSWLNARTALMKREKEATRLQDELAEARRTLPWVKIEKDYRFRNLDDEKSLADLFGGKSQLVVYHFMFGADWNEGCPSCSFWADSFDLNRIHLAARDVSLVAVSEAAPEKLAAYRKRMDWTFPWYSEAGSGFNRDFKVTFDASEIENGSPVYNFGTSAFPAAQAPGVSVFFRDKAGSVFHTYSAYARGLDILNATYQYLDLVPKGRDEGDLPHPHAWVRRHDSYGV